MEKRVWRSTLCKSGIRGIFGFGWNFFLISSAFFSCEIQLQALFDQRPPLVAMMMDCLRGNFVFFLRVYMRLVPVINKYNNRSH